MTIQSGQIGTGDAVPTMRYARRLTSSFMELLSGSGKYLVEVAEWSDSDPYAFDTQIRERDQLMIYHGTTALLTVGFDQATGTVTFSASKAYGEASFYDELMGSHHQSLIENYQSKLKAYLLSAVSLARDGYYRNQAEGYWQNRLSFAFGQHWAKGMDWLCFDREAVIGFASDSERRSVQEPIQSKYLDIKRRLQEQDSNRWGKDDGKGLGNECDFLAIGPGGELFCIELKHGSNASGVYWGSLQVSVYRDLFEAALTAITEDVKTLVRQKVTLGLLPQDALSRLPTTEFRKVLPVLAVAAPNEQSACWGMLGEVMQNSSVRGVIVAEIRNYGDPAPLIHLIDA